MTLAWVALFFFAMIGFTECIKANRRAKAALEEVQEALLASLEVKPGCPAPAICGCGSSHD